MWKAIKDWESNPRQLQMRVVQFAELVSLKNRPGAYASHRQGVALEKSYVSGTVEKVYVER